jgi:hypothetical protein
MDEQKIVIANDELAEDNQEERYNKTKKSNKSGGPYVTIFATLATLASNPLYPRDDNNRHPGSKTPYVNPTRASHEQSKAARKTAANSRRINRGK